jgi:hypothetical protein
MGRPEQLKKKMWSAPWHKTRALSPLMGVMLTPGNAMLCVHHMAEGFCVTSARDHSYLLSFVSDV